MCLQYLIEDSFMGPLDIPFISENLWIVSELWIIYGASNYY